MASKVAFAYAGIVYRCRILRSRASRFQTDGIGSRRFLQQNTASQSDNWTLNGDGNWHQASSRALSYSFM